MADIGVIGCGTWATVMSLLAAKNGHNIHMFCHKNSYYDAINSGENFIKLPGIKLPDTIRPTLSLHDAVENMDLLVNALSSSFVKPVFETLKSRKLTAPLLSLSKGFLDKNQGSGYPSVRLWLKNNVCDGPSGILSGPNLALEIADGKPAAAVVAFDDKDIAEQVQTLLSSDAFRVYTSLDCIGVELGGIIKNVIAIAAGISDGLGLGNNAKAALLTRGLQEMLRIGNALGADPKTFYGLSGMGDLIATCSSIQSRNYQVGQALAQNQSPDKMAISGVKEGIRTSKILMAIAKEKQLDLPITQEIFYILFEGKAVQEAMQALMERGLKSEA